MAETDTAPALDDETSAALTLFNEYVDANRERTRREKRITKAERAKNDAAALVKKLASGGSAEQKAEAEAAYREASEAWKRIRDGQEPEAKAEAEPEAEAKAEVETPEAETAEPDGETDRTDDDAEDAAGDSQVAEAPPADAHDEAE